MQSHGHGVTDPTHAHGEVFLGQNGALSTFATSTTGNGAAINSANVSTDPSGTGISIQSSGTGASQNMPPTAIVNKIIST